MSNNLIKYIIEANEEHYCKYCKQIYENVYQSECGCRYCFKCLEDAKQSLQSRCIICKEAVDFSIKIKDRGYQREIDNLSITCNICHWSGKMKDFEKHYEQQGCSPNENSRNNLSEDLSLFYKHSRNRLISLEKIFVSLDKKKLASKIFTNKNSLENDDLKMKINKLETNMNILKSKLTEALKNSEKCVNDSHSNESNQDGVVNELAYINKSLITIQSASIKIDERLSLVENKCVNGNFFWKVSEVKEKIEKAISGIQIYIDSDPFYTNTYGYKIYCRIYLNGHGSGHNTHLSLYVILMRGDYDVLLKWPFDKKITFLLIDQSENENIVSVLKPDLISTSYQRPITDTNFAVGIPKFCELNNLYALENKYIKENCMFIRIIVDSKGGFM